MTVNTSGTPVSWDDYYPFGSIMPGNRSSNNAAVDGRYKFTGKERDTETGYDWFNPDSWSGRWLQVDPLADKYLGWSPYNYALDNPFRYIDPNGKDIIFVFDKEGAKIAGMSFGHASTLIGNKKTGGWYLFSKNGYGEGNYQSWVHFNSLSDFANGESRYETGVSFKTTEEIDNQAKTTASELVKNPYGLDNGNCADLNSDIAKSVGIDLGKPKIELPAVTDQSGIVQSPTTITSPYIK